MGGHPVAPLPRRRRPTTVPLPARSSWGAENSVQERPFGRTPGVDTRIQPRDGAATTCAQDRSTRTRRSLGDFRRRLTGPRAASKSPSEPAHHHPHRRPRRQRRAAPPRSRRLPSETRHQRSRDDSTWVGRLTRCEVATAAPSPRNANSGAISGEFPRRERRLTSSDVRFLNRE